MKRQLKLPGSRLSTEEKTLERKSVVKPLIVKPFKRDLKLPNTEQIQAIKVQCKFESKKKTIFVCFSDTYDLIRAVHPVFSSRCSSGTDARYSCRSVRFSVKLKTTDSRFDTTVLWQQTVMWNIVGP